MADELSVTQQNGPRLLEEGRLSPADFDALYNRHKNSVYSFACYLAQNRKEADDLFQETWLRVVRHKITIVNGQDVKAWILTITANLHRDDLRKKRFRGRFDGSMSERYEQSPEVAGGFWGASSEPNELFERAEAGRAVRKALAGLPERQRSVFILKEMEGFKHSEISDILKIPVGTVKSLLFRALKSLQRELHFLDTRKSVS